MPSVVDLERKAFVKDCVYTLCRSLYEHAEDQEAKGGPQRLAEARRMDVRNLAWRFVREGMSAPPRLEEDFVEEPDGEAALTPVGIVHLTLSACGFPWPDPDPDVDRDVEAEDYIRLFLLYLDEWEAGRPKTLPRG